MKGLPVEQESPRVERGRGKFSALWGERPAAGQLFAIPFLSIQGTFLDTRRNLAKNLTTPRKVRGETRAPGQFQLPMCVFPGRVTFEG